MNYKALITDFDNTVAHDGDINIPVSNAITRLIDAGYIYSIATGRPYYDRVDEVCQELKIKHPVITFGGARIVDPLSGKTIWQENINDNEAESIISFFKEYNIYISVEGEDCVYTTDGNTLPLYAPNTPIKKIDNLVIEDIPKIIISARKNNLPEARIDGIITKLYSQFKDIHAIKTKVMGSFGLDITSNRGTKHVTTLELLKILNIKAEDVVGVGDGYNDYPLLTACGVKVAMGDAPDELKQIADFIAPSQKEDGILKVIEKYFPSKN